MIRATTGGVMRSYRANLMKSFITDNKARETVLTQRVFNSYAEDPAAASKAFRLRKSRMMTSSQLKICDDTYHKYQGAYASLQTVSKLIDTENSSSNFSTLKDTTLKMLNDPEGDARVQLNKALDNLSDTIVQNMNQKYGDEFIFAGADGHNVPFEVKEVDGKKQLYYRGVSVDAQDPNVLKDGDTFIQVTKDGKYDAAATNGTGAATNIYLKLGNTKIISKDTYDELTIMPEVVKGAGGEVVKYDENLNPIADGDEETPVAYYERADATGAGTGDFVTVEDYLSEVSKASNPPQRLTDTNGNVVEVNEDGVPTANGGYYLTVAGDFEVITKPEYEAEKLEADKLAYLMKEKRLVDIGLGFQEDENGNIIESSAFNECLNGLTFLGYGLDEDGDPKNIYSIVQRLTEIADGVPDGGTWSNDVYNEFQRLVGKLETSASNFKTEFTNQSAGTEKLKNNYDLLEDNVYNLKEQYSNLEDVNMADAISSFIWAEYCYNAALKVGNSILSQSLMDYLS